MGLRVGSIHIHLPKNKVTVMCRIRYNKCGHRTYVRVYDMRLGERILIFIHNPSSESVCKKHTHTRVHVRSSSSIHKTTAVKYVLYYSYNRTRYYAYCRRVLCAQ